METRDFTAKYPSIDTEDFQQRLLNKTEFVKIGKENVKADDIYFTFQRNVGILLSPVTPYKKMLFFFEPGVGKTCSSILVHEITKQFLNGQIRPTVIITKGKSLEDNYKTDFIKTCPGIEQHFSHDEEGHVIDKLAMDREVKANFSFKKYSAFASYLEKMSDDAIRETYSNRTYVLDEGQTIKNTKGKTYKQYLRFFDIVENVTVIILSGTPNTDHPSEAVGLINLVKRPEDRMVTGPKFLRRFYTGDEFDYDKEDELLAFYNGYATYLKQTSDIEPTQYQENPAFPSTFTEGFATYNLVMRPFQQGVYEKALTETHKTIRKQKEGGLDLLKRDKEGNLMTYESKGGGTFMKLAREAATFCYPDGSYGAAGFKRNLVKVGSRIDFKDINTANELKANLEKYSVSFAESFKIIKENPKRVIYIYFDNVNNSGLLMYGKLLELVLGFQLTDAKKTAINSKPKYVRIDGSLKTPISQLMRKVGQKENADASIVRVVLGSPLSGVGLTIPNATIVFVFDSQFTPSDITQIVNRINRPGTLKYVEEKGLPTDCKAYLFASATNKKVSIDLDIYSIAEHKVKLIEPQTELMERADPFCAISHERNMGEKPCYTATPDSKGQYKRTEKDERTDVLFWRQDEIENLDNEILEAVKQQPVKVSDYLDQHEPMIVYRTVKKITTSDKIVPVRIDPLLKIEDKGVIFLNGDLVFIDETATGDPNASWYLRTKTFPTQITLEDILSKMELEQDAPKIEKMFNDKDISIWKTLSKNTQISIWEELWSVSKPSKFQQKVLEQFVYYDIDGVPYNILYAEPKVVHTTANANAIVIENPSKIRMFVDSMWQYYKPPTVGALHELITRIKEQQKTTIATREKDVDQSWGVYGKYDKKGNFQIVRLDGGRTSGRQCRFFKRDDQYSILEKFGDVPDNFDTLDVEQRCNLIIDAFQKHDLVV